MPDFSAEAEHYIDETLLAELAIGDRVVAYFVPDKDIHGPAGEITGVVEGPPKETLSEGTLYLGAYLLRQRSGRPGLWLRSLRRAPDAPDRALGIR